MTTLKAKILTALILIVASACYNSNKKQKAGKNNNIQPSLNGKQMYDSILTGLWSICSEGGSDGTIIQYNVCPEILFKSNSVAILFLNGIASEAVRWTVERDTLFITHLSFFSKDTLQHFPDYKYLVTKTEDSASINLQLTQRVKRYFSALRKAKGKSMFDFIHK